jgi:broad specificity phosphatase PhoE
MGWPASLWLVRHAESAGNLADVAAHAEDLAQLDLHWRDADTPLSDTGRDQAKALAEWFGRLPADRRPDVVLTSPYVRAYETAAGLAPEVRLDERLRERDLGAFDGLTKRGITERYPEEAERRAHLGKIWYRPPGGESWADVALRVRAFVADLRSEYAGQRVVAVTHQAVLMCFRWVIDGLSEIEVLDLDSTSRVGNASVSRYELDGDRLRLEAFDDRSPVAPPDVEETAEPDPPAEEAIG